MVFYGMLMSLFSLFCFNCKADKPSVTIKRNGTMATVYQSCKVCGPKNPFQWRSQPLVLGKHPAGNILMSFGILMSGVSISKVMLLCRHVGMSMISPRTFFYHQTKFHFPALLHYWESYRTKMVDQLRSVKEPTWSGDGRYDSMGHSAKYGVYTMFCNTTSKLVHFELCQVCFMYTLQARG